jgi:hypothetical protein
MIRVKYKKKKITFNMLYKGSDLSTHEYTLLICKQIVLLIFIVLTLRLNFLKFINAPLRILETKTKNRIYFYDFPKSLQPHIQILVHLYIFFCFWQKNLQWARASSFTSFLDHTQRRTTIGRIPLDE